MSRNPLKEKMAYRYQNYRRWPGNVADLQLRDMQATSDPFPGADFHFLNVFQQTVLSPETRIIL